MPGKLGIKTILVVDDSAEMLTLIAALLKAGVGSSWPTGGIDGI